MTNQNAEIRDLSDIETQIVAGGLVPLTMSIGAPLPYYAARPSLCEPARYARAQPAAAAAEGAGRDVLIGFRPGLATLHDRAAVAAGDRRPGHLCLIAPGRWPRHPHNSPALFNPATVTCDGCRHQRPGSGKLQTTFSKNPESHGRKKGTRLQVPYANALRRLNHNLQITSTGTPNWHSFDRKAL